MTGAATAESLSLLEDESSGRAEFERARALAYSATREMDALTQYAGQLEDAYRATRGAEKRTRLALVLGVTRWILGRYEEALEPLADVKGSGDGAYFRGRCLAELGRYDEAAEAFELCRTHGGDKFEMAMCIADVQRVAGNLDGARKRIRTYQESHADRAELHYQKGRLLDEMGEREPAMEELERACELDPGHARAAFRLAYMCDLHGLDEMAIDYYERCAAMPTAYANVLLNLGLLYEDNGEYEQAMACYTRVAQADPQDERARLYARDAEGGLHMYYDEESRKRSDRTSALLLTPVSDFELSVRSRNCLAKMNVRCLRDLVRLTEQDLLAFKNFGETSLNEIKEMLRNKGLRFGMSLDEGQPVADVLAVPSPEQQDVMGRGIEELDLSIRSRRAVESLGIETVGDVCRHTGPELMECKNFGQTSLNEVRRKLAERGLSLREDAE